MLPVVVSAFSTYRRSSTVRYRCFVVHCNVIHQGRFDVASILRLNPVKREQRSIHKFTDEMNMYEPDEGSLYLAQATRAVLLFLKSQVLQC